MFGNRPLNYESTWGSEECPFELAPRWLTSPSEVSVNLVSTSSAGHPDRVGKCPWALRQTVKQFGTVKVRTTDDKLSSSPCF